jgi:hypothetical protein
MLQSGGVMLVHNIITDVFKISLMQHPTKLVFPTKHGFVAMSPKLATITHKMEENFIKCR